MKRFLPAVIGGLALMGVGVAFALNPAVVAKPVAGPNELLQNERFEQPVSLGAWNPTKGTSFDIGEDDMRAYDKRAGFLTGTITQEVLLTPVPGRAYRFSLWISSVPSIPGPTTGVLRAQTACAKDEEIEETSFEATHIWTQHQVTLQPVHGQSCSLRVGIQIDQGIAIIDNASFTDAGLVNPSFELGDGIESWTIDGSASAVVGTTRPVDGRRYLAVSTKTGGGIRQDVSVDPSSNSLLGSASVLVRAPSSPATVELQYREPCSNTIHRTKATLNNQWQLLTVHQARLAKNAYPKDIVQVNGVGCKAQVAVVVVGSGTVDVDSVDLELSTYWPAEGNPSYQKASKAQAASRGF